MRSHPNRSGGGVTPGHLLAGFVAGFIAVLLFHQGAWAALHAVGFTQRPPFPMQPTAPFGVPQLWSLAFWGGVWGIVLAALFHGLNRGKTIIVSIIFGLIAPTLVAWFIVAPLQGQPMAAGWNPSGMAFGLMVNAAWGLGAGFIFALLRRSRPTETVIDQRSGVDRRTRIVKVVEERRRALADRRAAFARRYSTQ
jgi:hypothetical protein